jgi:Protein of unknown function (DUF2849)
MTSPLDQKLRIDGPVVITANRLQDGGVIHRARLGGWTTDLAAALVVTTSEEAIALLKEAAGEGTLVVGAYAAPIEITPDKKILPGNLRERIRCAGPTFELPRVPVGV